MIESPFGKLLNAHRRQKNLTPGELAQKADVSPSYISLLIGGKKGRPSEKIIRQLAQALELTEDEMLEFQAAADESKIESSPNKSVQQLLKMSAEEAGIIAVHPYLSGDLLKEYFLRANKVHIKDSWLEDLFTYNSLFRETLQRERPDLAIEILLLNPESKVAKIRENVLSMPENYVSDKINSTIRFFKDLHKKFGSKYIGLRLFDVPSVQYIAFDETIFVGFYSHTARSQSTYQLQIKPGSALGNFFETDFIKVWDTAKRVNLELP